MTVKELIAKLEKMPQDMVVVTYNDCTNDPGYADDVIRLTREQQASGKGLYCQGCDFFEMYRKSPDEFVVIK